MSADAEGAVELLGEFEIRNRNGLHVRPAGALVEVASRFRSEVYISKDDVEVDGKSILQLMMLAAEHGSVLRLRVRGSDAPDAMDALRRLFEDRFGEE